MHTSTFCLVVSLLLLRGALLAQEINVKVTDVYGTPLASATISLLNAGDSSTMSSTVSDQTGACLLRTGKAGNYLVAATHLGFVKSYSNQLVVASNGKPIFVQLSIAKVASQLSNINVQVRKQPIEARPDRTVLNVEASVNSTGTNALELLKKAPGVMVDNDNNISMNGRNGVQVFIDGKASPLSNADLAAYLGTLQSVQIEAIELITNPSSKFDAAGSGGVINIKLKRNKNNGTNAAISQGYAIGTYSKYNTALNVNYRNNKVNVFAAYTFSKGINFTDFLNERVVGDTLFNLHSLRKLPERTHGFNTGFDFFANRKSTFGILVNGNITKLRPGNYSVTPITTISSGRVNRILVSDNQAERKLTGINFNTNYHYSGGRGLEFNLDADYGMFRNKNRQQQPNVYFNAANGELLGRSDYLFVSPSEIDVYSLKSDYENTFGKATLGFGGKMSLVKTNNHFERYNVYPAATSLDVARSNQFDYSEQINALYINYTRSYIGLIMQLGLRVEHTTSEGATYALLPDGQVNLKGKKEFKRQYADLFPNMVFTFNKNPDLTWGFTLNRRIDRPRYDYLNPFEYKLDEYNYRKGNPNLVPQYSNTISVSNVYRKKLVSKISVGYLKNVFAQIVDTTEKSKSFITNENLASQQIASMNVSYPVTYKNYSGFFSMTGFYSQYRADFGGGERKINLDVFAYNFTTQNVLKLKQGFSFEVNGNYNSPTIWQGSFRSSRAWNLDAGAQKLLIGGKATLRVLVTDIFYKQNPGTTSTFAGQASMTRLNMESRQLRLNFNYRFGNIQLKAARARSTGADDEMKRSRAGS